MLAVVQATLGAEYSDRSRDVMSISTVRGKREIGRRERGGGVCKHLGFRHDDWSFMYCRISEPEKADL